MKRIQIFLTLLLLGLFPMTSNGQGVFFDQGFETDNSGWDVFSSGLHAIRVPSGTNGITSRTGSYHAEAGPAATNWGGYNCVPGCDNTGCAAGAVFPANGWQTSVDVYLDLTMELPNDTRFDFTSAVSRPEGSHRRDFAFNAGFYFDTTPPGSGPRFVVSASNNTGRGNSYPKNPGRDPFVISASGWHTFQHTFYDNGSGVLACDLSILDPSGSVLHTWTLSDATDLINIEVAANRYGWFANNEFGILAIDNSKMIKLEDGPSLPHDYLLLATVDIEISAATATEGDMHANDDIDLNRGAPTVHTGSLTAGDDIDISSDNTITGDITAGDDVDNDGTVDGTVTEEGAVSPVDIPPLAPFAAGTEDITVEDEETLDLPPGSYGDVEVERDGILNLSAGEYFLEELILNTDTQLNIDLSGGPVFINVVNKLRFGDRSVVSTSEGEGGSGKVFFNSLQSSNLELRRESTVLGTIVAPDAKVRAESYVHFRGAICAEDISFSTGGTILHHSSQSPPKQVVDRDEENAAQLPQQYELAQNYPNPFNPTTTIGFTTSDVGFVELKVYDIAGRLVKTLVSESREAGNYTVSWDATDDFGKTVTSGIYFYRIQTADFRQVKKMILMK